MRLRPHFALSAMSSLSASPQTGNTMPVYVIRPGETDYESQSRVQGALNLPMNSEGNRQVDDMISSIESAGLQAIYASPTEPALSAAKRLAQALHLPLKVLDNLENVDFGLWQGLSIEEIRHRQPKVFKKWEDTPESVCPPEGETCDEVVERVEQALRKPLKKRKPFAVVASEPLATLIVSLLKGQSPQFPGPQSSCHPAHRVECIEELKSFAG